MNLAKPLRAAANLIYSIYLRSRFLLPRQQSRTFVHSPSADRTGIGRTYVINLDSEPDRWLDVIRELNHVLDVSGTAIGRQTTRYSAVDARKLTEATIADEDVYPFYTLGDQLFVEPSHMLYPISLSSIALSE